MPKWCGNGALVALAVEFNTTILLNDMEEAMHINCHKNDKPCMDHQGNSYPNIKAMCARWGIHPETFTRRINVYGLSVEAALTRAIKPNGGKRCFDHTGRKYKSLSMMCRHWNIDRKLFEYRISHGWSLEDALTRERRKQKNIGNNTDGIDEL